jgi:C_GCAxxG_C_C family probable redox protein
MFLTGKSVIVMDREKKAIEYHRRKFNCSQSVLAVFSDEHGVRENECLKIATAFGGGMARQQYTCGAITGAMMVLGLRFGMGVNDPEENKLKTYAKTRELFSEFKKLHGSTCCLDLLDGLNMNDPDDFKKIVDQKLIDVRCEKYISDAVLIAERLMK